MKNLKTFEKYSEELKNPIEMKVETEIVNNNEDLIFGYLNGKISKGTFEKKLKAILNKEYGNVLLDLDIDKLIAKIERHYSPAWTSREEEEIDDVEWIL